MVRLVERRELMRNAAAGGGGAGGGQVIGSGVASAGAHPRGGALGRLSIVFLSHVNDPAVTPVFPGDPPFVLDTVATVAEDGFYMQYVQEAEHTGSHWGAPAHFQEGGLPADQPDP